jgi:hypothetical protein
MKSVLQCTICKKKRESSESTFCKRCKNKVLPCSKSNISYTADISKQKKYNISDSKKKLNEEKVEI